MEISQAKAEIISELEEIVAGWTYNRRGDGDKGDFCRYPFIAYDPYYKCICKHDSKFTVVTPDAVEDMHYDFGTNKLYIGDALAEVLEYLENRYHLDFTELEKEEQTKFHTDDD